MKNKEKDKYAKMAHNLQRMRRAMSIWIAEKGLTDELVDCLAEIKKDGMIMHLRTIIEMKEREISILKDERARDDKMNRLKSTIEQQEQEINDLEKELMEYKRKIFVNYNCTM